MLEDRTIGGGSDGGSSVDGSDESVAVVGWREVVDEGGCCDDAVAGCCVDAEAPTANGWDAAAAAAKCSTTGGSDTGLSVWCIQVM